MSVAMSVKMSARNRAGWTMLRCAVGVSVVALLAGLSVEPARAGDRGSGGVVKPVKPISGCSARLQGDRAQARWTNVAYQTGEFQVGESAASSVRRAAATGRLSQHAVGFDGRDGEGLWLSHATVGYDLDAGELLATRAPYPAKAADDVDRPGFSVGWSTRAIVGGVKEWNHPYATDAAAYGAYGVEDSVALVRVGPYVVPVDPWRPVSQDGPRATREVRERLERGRQEWLRERGFVGQVRTFVNDAVGSDASGARGSEARRADRPVAKFLGVSRTSDAPAMSDAESDAGQGVEASKALRQKEAGASESVVKVSGVKLSEAPGASAVVHVNQKPITRISLPHVAGLKNAGTRVVESRAKEPANDAGK